MGIRFSASNGPTGLDALAQAVINEPEGNRNNVLFWAAIRAVEEDFAEADVMTVLLAAAQKAGLEKLESRRTISSGLRRVSREQGRGTRVAGDTTDWLKEKKAKYGYSDPDDSKPDDPEFVPGDGILNVVEYLKTVPTDIPWIIEGFIFLHGVTLVTGLPKAGKSTFCSEMQRCFETPEEKFLGRETMNVPALLVTEESGVPVGFKVRHLRNLDIYDRKASKGESFRDTLNKVAAWAERSAGGVVFIDTFAVWATVDDENDASKVTAAMNDINALASQYDVAVVLVHHERKGGGKFGEGVRGSGAMVASVDILVEIKRTDTNNRTERYIDALGRVMNEERTLINYDPLTRRYDVVDTVAVEDAGIEKELAGIAPDGPGLTRADIEALWQKDGRKRIGELLNRGRLRTKREKVGRAWKALYWSIPPSIGRATPDFDSLEESYDE